MDFSQKRWISLAAAMLAALVSGVIYSFSVYVNPLMAEFGWSKGSISFAFTLNIIASAVVPVVCANMRKRMSISFYNLIGAIFYGGGMILCGFMQSSVYEFYLYFGVLVGAGIGFVYVSLAVYVVQLFPDRKGLAAGLYTGCYGCAAFFWAPAASYLMANYGGVNNAFIYLGVFFTIALIIISRFLFEIPEGFTETYAAAGKSAKPILPPLDDKKPAELFSTPIYYVIMVMYTLGMSSGLMALSLGSPILQSTLQYTPEKAAVVVGFFAIASAGGRLFWGWFSDKIGRPNVLICLFVITAGSMIVLYSFSTEFLFISAILLVPCCYGAYAATLSPVSAECFGPKNAAQNYNMVFPVFAFAAIIGPQIIAYSEKSTGTFQAAFMAAVILAVAGLAGAFIFRAMVNKRRTELDTVAPAVEFS